MNSSFWLPCNRFALFNIKTAVCVAMVTVVVKDILYIDMFNLAYRNNVYKKRRKKLKYPVFGIGPLFHIHVNR